MKFDKHQQNKRDFSDTGECWVLDIVKHECTAKEFSVRFGFYVSKGSLLGSGWAGLVKGYEMF